jgi:hypothetical protein
VASDTTLSVRFADLWSMLHEGGITVETRTGAEGSPIAFRTLLQIDGGRLLRIGQTALGPLTPCQRLRLAVRHRQAVRSRSIAVLLRLRRDLVWLRYGLIALFAGTEVHRVITDWPFVQLDWRTLLWHQVPSLVMLAMGVIVPWTIRLIAPYLLRLIASRTIRERLAAHRAASHAFLARVTGDLPG